MKTTLALLALLALPACQNTADTQRLGALVSLAITTAAARGVITPQDAADIRAAQAILLPPIPPAAPGLTFSGK